MFTPDTRLLQFISLSSLGAAYVLVIFYAFRRQQEQGTGLLLAGLISLYALVGMGLTIVEAFWRDGRLPSLAERAFLDLQIFAMSLLAFLMLLTILGFLRRRLWAWVGIAAFWGVGLGLILSNRLNLPPVLWTNGEWVLPGERLGIVWALLGWGVFGLGGGFTLQHTYRNTRQPLLRNRLWYWLPIFALVLINDSLIIIGAPLPGNILRLAIALLIAYAALSHNLPDVRQIARRVLVYFITTFLIVLFYIIGFVFSQRVFQAAPNFNPLLLGASIALLLSMLFTPLLSMVRRLVDRLLRIEQYDVARTLHEYSQSISNILDMGRLASVAVGIIMEALEVERGFLFLVDSQVDASGQTTYRLRAVRSPAERRIVVIGLDENGPIASYFLNEQRPLLQYDLDLLPVFQTASELEREWFRRLEAEVYVPIFAKQRWIGLLAFGPKLSGNRYTEEDLLTLRSLANQTAVALENARLVDNLLRLNTELRQARRALEKANRDLQRLDQTKSDFISIASHELRTPLTVIKGYTEMLLEDPGLDSARRSMIKGIHEGTLRLHQIMDSMLDLAQLDTRTMQLHLQQVDLSQLLREVCQAYESVLKERQQTLHLDLPMLPTIKADPVSLQKVFQHLVNNAIKFTPNGGKITITAQSRAPNQGDFPYEAVEIVVSDTGVGVDPRFREVIFTKFYQSGDLSRHSTSKTRFKGSGAGLGLALSKGIVEAHGGRIWVESPGYDEVHFPGSQFHVLLPLSQPVSDETLMMSMPFSLHLPPAQEKPEENAH